MKVTKNYTADAKKTEEQPRRHFLESGYLESRQGMHEASSSGTLDPTRGRIATCPMPLPRRKAQFDFSANFSGSFLAVQPTLEKASVEQLRTFEKANPVLKNMCTPLWERFCGKKVLPTESETWRDAYERSIREAEARGQAFLAKYKRQAALAEEAKQTLQPCRSKELPSVPIVAPHGLKKKTAARSNPGPEESKKTYLNGVQRGFLMKKVSRTVKRR
uniref:HMG box domain-containing protein n=1 Tax=Steinernema glaseri TaxID=37863 RepID=A0A1I8A7V9_9BILA